MWISRICEEFGCGPTAALEEWERNPDLVERVIEVRGYMRVYDAAMHATDEKAMPKGHFAGLFWEYQVEIAQKAVPPLTTE
jgi:hypothetical protein